MLDVQESKLFILRIKASGHIGIHFINPNGKHVYVYTFISNLELKYFCFFTIPLQSMCQIKIELHFLQAGNIYTIFGIVFDSTVFMPFDEI